MEKLKRQKKIYNINKIGDINNDIAYVGSTN